MTKCALEMTRKASSLESLAAEDWQEAIKEVIIEAKDASLAPEDGDPAGVIEEEVVGEFPPDEAVAPLLRRLPQWLQRRR